MRTYSGHSSARASNALYRTNLARGQTGLSVAFDLPTQTGYDADHPLAKGEVGKVGVPIGHLGDMEALFEGIPLARMNTSMTINATAPWLLALYIAAAERQGAARADLAGTVQNDIVKEYLSRGTHIFPPAASLRLTADEKLRRFRYGVQVNSLGLTEQQPENNVYRILLEMLAVVLSKDARARAVQLPAWNEALGLPRPWDQQWSIRLQQIVAEETDLLDYGDIFDGSKEIENKVEALKAEARAELGRVLALGGAIAAIESGYMKKALVESNAERLRAIEAGETKVVGVNA